MKRTVMLKKNYEFKSVLKKGTFYRGNFIDVFIKNNGKNINKIGIAVSKKAGNSVKRNKIKRLIRENYKQIEEKIKIGYSIVFLWKKGSEENKIDFYSIQEDFKNLIKKL